MTRRIKKEFLYCKISKSLNSLFLTYSSRDKTLWQTYRLKKLHLSNSSYFSTIKKKPSNFNLIRKQLFQEIKIMFGIKLQVLTWYMILSIWLTPFSFGMKLKWDTFLSTQAMCFTWIKIEPYLLHRDMCSTLMMFGMLTLRISQIILRCH
jgi:hypothetical protein